MKRRTFFRTTGVRQAMIILPKNTEWQELRGKAEIEVKGKTYPVEWARTEKINDDGSFTLERGV